MPTFQIKRIYDMPSANDGYRVLVDRLWPRGVSKEEAQLDEWNKDIAPSSELRKWFGHDPTRLTAFSEKYNDELSKGESAAMFLASVKDEKVVTLLYGAKNPSINHAVVLRQFLDSST